MDKNVRNPASLFVSAAASAARRLDITQPGFLIQAVLYYSNSFAAHPGGRLEIPMRRYKRNPFTLLAVALSLAALMSGCGQSGAKAADSEGAGAALAIGAETSQAADQTAPLPSEIIIEAPPEAGAETPQETAAETPREDAAAPSRYTSSPLPPSLPQTGAKLDDFIPEGWTLLDSAALDFNRDGYTDYVGVLDASGEDIPSDTPSITPRILFAVASCGENSLRLDFQDENLIRTRDEGGVFGDPYVPLTADGTTFTTNAFGGSAWKWSEAYTYAYRDGTWYLSSAHTTYGYGPIVTEENEDDYETGIGIRRKRSSDLEHLENADGENAEFDLVYQVRLDAPPDISQAGKRWWLSPDRLMECPVKTIAIADGIDLECSQVKLPLEGSIQYRDENLILYTFTDQDGQKSYLSCYLEGSQSLTVVAEDAATQSAFDSCFAYKGKVYYTIDELADVSVKNSDGTLTTSNRLVAQTLYRRNTDGSDLQEIFQYRLVQPGETIPDTPLPYIFFSCEPTGDELIVQVYLGGRPQPFYRMNLDGSNVREIGLLPASE